MPNTKWCSKHNQYAHTCKECLAGVGKQAVRSLAIMPGDFLTVVVPKIPVLNLVNLHAAVTRPISTDGQYHLAPGKHTLRISCSLAAKLAGELKFRVFPRNTTRRISVTIPSDPKLTGYLFLSRDKFPVPFTHEPNLTTRMKRSIRERNG